MNTDSSESTKMHFRQGNPPKDTKLWDLNRDEKN